MPTKVQKALEALSKLEGKKPVARSWASRQKPEILAGIIEAWRNGASAETIAETLTANGVVAKETAVATYIKNYAAEHGISRYTKEDQQ